MSGSTVCLHRDNRMLMCAHPHPGVKFSLLLWGCIKCMIFQKWSRVWLHYSAYHFRKKSKIFLLVLDQEQTKLCLIILLMELLLGQNGIFVIFHSICLCLALYWMAWECFEKAFSILIFCCNKLNVNMLVYGIDDISVCACVRVCACVLASQWYNISYRGHCVPKLHSPYYDTLNYIWKYVRITQQERERETPVSHTHTQTQMRTWIRTQKEVDTVHIHTHMFVLLYL